MNILNLQNLAGISRGNDATIDESLLFSDDVKELFVISTVINPNGSKTKRLLDYNDNRIDILQSKWN